MKRVDAPPAWSSLSDLGKKESDGRDPHNDHENQTSLLSRPEIDSAHALCTRERTTEVGNWIEIKEEEK